MIAYNRLKTTNNESEPTSALQIAIAGAIIALLNVCPFAFCAIGVKYRTRLDESDVKKKFGTLYNGLKAKNNQAIGYSIVFLVRRSLFVAITFSLFGRQLQTEYDYFVQVKEISIAANDVIEL